MGDFKIIRHSSILSVDDSKKKSISLTVAVFFKKKKIFVVASITRSLNQPIILQHIHGILLTDTYYKDVRGHNSAVHGPIRHEHRPDSLIK